MVCGVVCGGLRWFVVWFVVVCDGLWCGLWWFVVFSATRFIIQDAAVNPALRCTI